MQKIQINGFLVLDKPIGLTSNQALQKVKRIYRAKKAGHCGCLDPLASGVLPICLGEATKFSQFLLDADKQYLVTACLGVVTDTADSDGKVIKTSAVPRLDKDMLLEVCSALIGKQEQVPPMFSALKVNGQPLYRLARQGKEVARAAREIEIFALDLLGFSSHELNLFVHCSKGTYVRSLVESIGENLGCGAHVTMLRRLKSGPFTNEQAVSLEALGSIEAFDRPISLLQPMEVALADQLVVRLSDKDVTSLRYGQIIELKDQLATGIVRLQDRKGRFFGVGEVISSGKIKAKRLTSFG